MKTFLPQLTLLLLAGFAFGQTPQKQSLYEKENQSLLSSALHSPSDDWVAAAQKNIAAAEYFFRPSGTASYLAANRKQRLCFTITAEGYSCYPLNIPAKKQQAGWQQHIAVSGIRKGSTGLAVSNQYTVTAKKSSLLYASADYNIEYINNEDGLRQNFIVKKDPGGKEPLQVFLKSSGGLNAAALDNAVQFKDSKNSLRLFYTGLDVWDADNKKLPAKMYLQEDSLIVITVDDAVARYPVTIDPINKTPEWSSSADGILPSLTGQLAVDAAYGFSLAALGDVNGDGYADVAIGAPLMTDIISGSGTLAAVGAVFVYYGSPTGLPAAPSAVLQPNTPVAGALFGYSIAGGDINNDGYADIVVGAPMDMVTISTGGSNTASGTVGKVYVFNGNGLTTGTSPLLSLQLSGNGILENGINLSVNALFGFSVAVTEDLNNDGRRDIITGAPAYLGIKKGLLGNSLPDVQSGGAFVFLSNDNAPHTLVKLDPIKTGILGLPILQSNINGLLFGYSVDGVGDYNGDGYPDVIASAPAGVDLSSLSALLNGKLLQGSATVYYGNGNGLNTNPGATLTATAGGLLSNITGSISNIANLFGVAVKGLKTPFGTRNGNVLAGAPLGGTVMNVLGLQLKTGTVSLFKKQTGSPSGYVAPDQVLSSPRNSNTILQLVQCNLLFGYSLDNALDINCDGISDIIVGEPASSGVQLVNANVAGGAAYVYLGNPDGSFQTNPYWTLTATEDAFLGINATSLIGYSVAGAGYIKGITNNNKILVGTPSRSLDFGSGLLNLGGTLGTIFSLAAGDNGLGKAYLFDLGGCNAVLPASYTNLKGVYNNGITQLTWKTSSEINSSHFEIERGDDGIHFSVTGTVKASGNSDKTTSYSFDDIRSMPGENYYRIKIVDKDGRYSYSNTIAVSVTLKGTVITGVYPAPYTDVLNITVSSQYAATARCILFDNTGKFIRSVQTSLNKGITTIVLPGLDGLSKAVYYLRVQAGETVFTKKIVK